MSLNTEMKGEEIEAVMERAWDLHDKINDAIHNLSKSHFLNFIHKNSAIPSHPNPPSFLAQPHWVKDEPSNGHNGLGSYTQQHQHIQNGDPTTQCGDFMQEADRFAETRSLNAIRNALEVLEDNLQFLHTMQLQQRATITATCRQRGSSDTMHGTNGIERMGFASLTAWNMKNWKPLTILPLGEDPPAVTSICFNHNGKILAASATDGMIHMFDMSAGLQITGWPAHDSAVSCVKFGPDEASIFSLGSDGKIFEWSLHNQGQVLWSQDCSRFCSLESFSLPRHEMALDANGRRLLVTSNTFTSPLYQIQGKTRGQKTLQHGAPITSVDWHPVMPIFLTGSADHSVHVTSIS